MAHLLRVSRLDILQMVTDSKRSGGEGISGKWASQRAVRTHTWLALVVPDLITLHIRRADFKRRESISVCGY